MGNIELTNFIWGSEENCIKRFTEINQMFASIEMAYKDETKRKNIISIMRSLKIL